MTPELPQPPRKGGAIRTVWLSQTDFARGPVTIDRPDTVVKLRENVVVSFPDPPARQSPFHLGWFAAIIIGASRVVIDLNGKTLSMHPNYVLSQRFFSLISLDVTPFPDKEGARMGFTTKPVSPSDLTVRNGRLGRTSHFCVHASTLKTGRVLLSDLRMEDYEVGAVSLSGASDIMIRRCVIGRPVPPTSSAEFNALKDLAASARRAGAVAEAEQLMILAVKRNRQMTASDAIVRAVVISPFFNVKTIPDVFHTRIARVAILDTEVEDLNAEPVETIGCSLTEGGEPLKDVNGNLVSLSDALAGNLVAKLQASLNPDMPRVARERLMAGPCAAFHPIRGLDIRAHSLIGKSTAVARVDGATDVTVRNLRANAVRSNGAESAAVGLMLNGCERVSLTHVRVRSVHVGASCTNALSDDRPQSGLLVRRCTHVRIDDYDYEGESSCGSVLRHTKNATLSNCNMSAPSVFHKCSHIVMD